MNWRRLIAVIVLAPVLTEFITGNVSIVSLSFVGYLELLVTYSLPALVIVWAQRKWKLGWGAVFLLGCIAGAINEGILAGTFTAAHVPVSALDSFGSWLGINWVWAISITIWQALHAVVYPIALAEWLTVERRGVVQDRRTMGLGIVATVLWYLFWALHVLPAVTMSIIFLVVGFAIWWFLRRAGLNWLAWFALGDCLALAVMNGVIVLSAGRVIDALVSVAITAFLVLIIRSPAILRPRLLNLHSKAV